MIKIVEIIGTSVRNTQLSCLSQLTTTLYFTSFVWDYYDVVKVKQEIKQWPSLRRARQKYKKLLTERGIRLFTYVDDGLDGSGSMIKHRS